MTRRPPPLSTCQACGQKLPKDGGTLGNLVRTQRLKMHFTLRDVERITEGAISNAYLSQIETGKIKDPSATMVVNIAAALCLDIDSILIAIDPLMNKKFERIPNF